LKTKPSLSEFKEMAKQGNLVPVFEEFLADIETPVSAYLKIRDKGYSYLLESAEGGERWGRYSFIGYKPHVVVLSRGNTVEVQEGAETRTYEDVKNPLYILRDLSRKYVPVTTEELAPFQGGLVGFFSFDLIRTWEDLSGFEPDDKATAECLFTASRRLIMFDHFKHQMTLVAFAHLSDGKDPQKAYSEACQEIEEMKAELAGPIPAYRQEDAFSLSELEPNFRKEDFEEAVRKAKEYIVAGDIIQVVLSQRFSGRISGDDFLLYRSLRSVNPSPYMFYLNFGEIKLIGASPEILVRLTGGKIELRPIAGTRPRGKTKDEDLTLEKDLIADPKERAEHIMLVDLGRNDVGKVSVAGSVTVPDLMVVERYSHVMHIVSSVEGKLKPDMDSFDLFMSAFPAGTVSGAPKIRAMEIISELEPTARGPYAGAIGYFSFNGNMDFCITIRTIAVVRDQLSIQVGAGIVADSSPEGEYQETLRKGGAMFRAIERVKE
jgi:anthranilate synthase component I